VVPSTTEYDGQKLFTKENAKLLATPLFAVLVLIETTDVVFAVDSVPAVLAVSREQYIVFASNAFAILGLRALYFLLADWHNRFEYLQQGLAVILVYVGIKMIVSHWYHINTVVSLTFIGLILLTSILLSLRKSRRDDEAAPVHPAHE
jgi:tellurite resistance protein TerC